MRILTWNINGVRTLPQYHPWNTMPTFNDILDALEADILCFQEVKSSRSALNKGIAAPQSYHAFFSFPIRKSGYSGVSTYVRISSATPLKAEEGLCGILQPKPPLSAEERVSGPEAYPQFVLGETEGVGEEPDYKDLDSEGRTLVLDFGLFVLINVYCPNDGNGTEERDRYKADFHTVLGARVKGLIELEGREVIVVGDLNACAAIVDHCEGQIMVARGLAEGLEGEEGFWGKNARRWLRSWMVSEDETGSGPMVDITRKLWPDRKGMYTCWNTKISARETNYGTRIDYVMITKGLLPWVKGADIQPQIKGSDHCPVYLDLHDEIVDSSGIKLSLSDSMGFKPDSPKELPRIATKFWDEYSGKQKLLHQFFGNPAIPSPPITTASTSSSTKRFNNGNETAGHTASIPKSDDCSTGEDMFSSQASLDTTQASSPLPPSSSPLPQSSQPIVASSSSTAIKRKLAADTLTSNSSKKPKQKKDEEKKGGQAKLSSFFAKPAKPTVPPPAKTSEQSSAAFDSGDYAEVLEVDLDADHRLALLLSSQESEPSKPSGADSTEAKQAWTSLLAPVQPPKCSGHGEPARELTVNKAGPNKGKRFFICSRPVGTGYDKGRSERLREHVDPQYKCDFFKWSSEVRREMMRKKDSS